MTRDKILKFGSLIRRGFSEPRGSKSVWLPNFTLTLLRTPHLPANWAQFIVPLNMNKLDIKDYLWRAYNVPILSVRSYVQQSPVQLTKRGPRRAIIRRWNRPKSVKKMTVEMGLKEEGRNGKGGGVFVWPDPPNEGDNQDAFEPWDKRVFDAAQQSQHKLSEMSGRIQGNRMERPGKEAVLGQARQLLEGKEIWKPTWKDVRVQR